jgi:4-hydroxybenzoyl-CoA thioesterase
MRKQYGIVGMPLVEQGTKFIAPCRFDEEIAIDSEVSEWGRSSFTVRHQVMKDGDLAVEGFEKRVWAVLDSERPGRIKPEPIPREIMASLSDPTGATRCTP